jgi:hypothetical protein
MAETQIFDFCVHNPYGLTKGFQPPHDMTHVALYPHDLTSCYSTGHHSHPSVTKNEQKLLKTIITIFASKAPIQYLNVPHVPMDSV